jgi:hypothetical protein
MKLLNISRGDMFDAADGARLSLHIWIGPFGLHLFRRPLGVVPDFDR